MRGLKPLSTPVPLSPLAVAPLAGAWIETKCNYCFIPGCSLSHPSRVRGLKLEQPNTLRSMGNVAPLAGAWIETANAKALADDEGRTPRGCVD